MFIKDSKDKMYLGCLEYLLVTTLVTYKVAYRGTLFLQFCIWNIHKKIVFEFFMLLLGEETRPTKKVNRLFKPNVIFKNVHSSSSYKKKLVDSVILGFRELNFFLLSIFIYQILILSKLYMNANKLYKH